MNTDVQTYDQQKDKELYNYFKRPKKITALEITLLSFTVIIILALIGVGIYLFLTKQLIFDTYIRKEGPPGTVSAESTVPMVS